MCKEVKLRATASMARIVVLQHGSCCTRHAGGIVEVSGNGWVPHHQCGGQCMGACAQACFRNRTRECLPVCILLSLVYVRVSPLMSTSPWRCL